MIRRTSLALALGALAVINVNAQSVLTTVQQFMIGPQPDGWSFNFQISRFIPSAPSDTLTEVQILLSETSTYPQFTVTASQDTSISNSFATEQNGYSANAPYLITPSAGTYFSNTHQ